MMSEDSEQAKHYKQLVLQYEALSKQIHELIQKNGGHSENMSQTEFQVYRQLAQQRDDFYDQIRTIEAQWLDES